MRTSRLIPCLTAALLIGACSGNDSVAAKANTSDAQDPAVASGTTGGESVLKGIPAGKYGLDKSHAYINMGYSHLGFSHPTLGFREFDVDLTLDNEDINNSELNVTIDVSSIDSRVADFNEHLAGEKLFDTANHPAITFKGTKFKMTSADTLDVTGDLTIKGITRPVTLKTKVNKAANHPMRKVPTIGVSAATMIKRSDFGISYATPHVGDDVEITIEVEMPIAK